MSNNAPSYKSLIGQLNEFANGHFIIRDFSYGEITDFDLAQDGEYPVMHVLHPTVTVAEGVINYDLTIIFADLPRDFENKTEYQMEQISDLFRLGQDLLNVIRNENTFKLFGDEATIDGTPTMTAEAQETKNNLVQVTLEFTLQLPNDWSACDIPADWVIGQSGGSNVLPPTCCDVEYYISKNYQPDNTFEVGDVIRVSGSNTFALAQANTEANAAAVGVVTVAGPSFNYKMGGIITEGVPNVAAGTVLYLSDTVAGGLTATPPAIRRPIMVVVESGERAILDIHWMSAGGGGGSGTVTSVGLTMPSAFSVSGSPVTSSGTLAVTGAGTSGQYIDGTGALQTFPTIPTGTVESVSDLSPSAIDNTDPQNPVTNIIPRSGTDATFPITGSLEVDSLVEIFREIAMSGKSYIKFIDEQNLEISATNLFGFSKIQSLADTVVILANAGNYDSFVEFSEGAVKIESDNPSFLGARYAADYSANYTNRSLVDKEYVDNAISGGGASILDDAYGSGWDGDTTNGASRNALYDKIQTLPQQDSFTQSGNFGYVTVAAGVTTYGPYYGSQANFNTTQATRRIAGVVSGTISNCRITTGGAQPGTGSLVFTLQKNGADTSVVITVAAGSAAGSFVDSVNTVSVVDGDDLNWKVVNNASGASAIVTGFCSLFTR